MPPDPSLFHFAEAVRRDPAVEAWFAHGDVLRGFAQPWFERSSSTGDR